MRLFGQSWRDPLHNKQQFSKSHSTSVISLHPSYNTLNFFNLIDHYCGEYYAVFQVQTISESMKVYLLFIELYSYEDSNRKTEQTTSKSASIINSRYEIPFIALPAFPHHTTPTPQSNRLPPVGLSVGQSVSHSNCL